MTVDAFPWANPSPTGGGFVPICWKHFHLISSFFSTKGVVCSKNKCLCPFFQGTGSTLVWCRLVGLLRLDFIWWCQQYLFGYFWRQYFETQSLFMLFQLTSVFYPSVVQKVITGDVSTCNDDKLASIKAIRKCLQTFFRPFSYYVLFHWMRFSLQ